MTRTWMLALLAACAGGSPVDDTDAPTAPTAPTDPGDTDAPLPPGDRLLADLDGAGADAVCGALGPPVTLGCDGYALVYGVVEPSCGATLDAVPATCTLAVQDLLACAEVAATASCATDVSEEPCRALFSSDCVPLDAVGTALLGGPYGLQDVVPLGGLTPSQATAHCFETTDFEPIAFSCPEGDFNVSPGPIPECVDNLLALPDGCPAAVGDSRACVAALISGDCAALFGGGDCALLGSEACAP